MWADLKSLQPTPALFLVSLLAMRYQLWEMVSKLALQFAKQIATLLIYSCHSILPSPPLLPVPSSPPEGVQLVPVSSTSLRLEWGLPEAQERNGIITQYLVECTGPMVSAQSPVVLSSPTFAAPPSHQQLLTGLAPFTQYSCRVAAVNVNGTGPFSALANNTTLEGCELCCTL